MLRKTILTTVPLAAVMATSSSFGAVVFDLGGMNGLDNGSRWNAAATSFSTSGGTVERSLVGGLRYSLSGGTYEAYRDMFTWDALPSITDFQSTVQQAFVPWTVVDPESGFGTQLSFVEDLATPVDSGSEGFVRLGAEIDLFAGNIGTGTRGEAFFTSRGVTGGVTLTSGTTGYGGFAISGADITMNTNSVSWTLNEFQTILTHEIGHAIGLGDVEDFGGNLFIDDNYNETDPTATLTNSWASLVDALDPGNSGLALFDMPDIDAPGVDILMESSIPNTFFVNGASLANDDFGGRQFLYPEISPVPEPALPMLVALCWPALACIRRRRSGVPTR